MMSLIFIKYIPSSNDLQSKREKDSSSWKYKTALNLLQGWQIPKQITERRNSASGASWPPALPWEDVCQCLLKIPRNWARSSISLKLPFNMRWSQSNSKPWFNFSLEHLYRPNSPSEFLAYGNISNPEQGFMLSS